MDSIYWPLIPPITVTVIIIIWLIIVKRYWIMPTMSPSVRYMAKLKKEQEAEELRFQFKMSYWMYNSQANKRAADLLWSHLNNGQRNELMRYESFNVYTPRGRFEIHLNGAVNYATPKGASRYACIHVADPHLPLMDKLLALKLCAEANPDRFLRIANIRN